MKEEMLVPVESLNTPNGDPLSVFLRPQRSSMYKTLFFALTTAIMWIGSLILAFFAGAIVMSMWDDEKKPAS